eukprot:2235655-Prymnesium_polylepis.1
MARAFSITSGLFLTSGKTAALMGASLGWNLSRVRSSPPTCRTANRERRSTECRPAWKSG